MPEGQSTDTYTFSAEDGQAWDAAAASVAEKLTRFSAELTDLERFVLASMLHPAVQPNVPPSPSPRRPTAPPPLRFRTGRGAVQLDTE
jgi:hypothetical protein